VLGYVICPDGAAWSRWRPGCRIPTGEWHQLRGKSINGYRAIMVHRKRLFIHILVLENFVGPRPDGYQGLHRDDDRGNNAVGNLYWGTPGDNMRDRERHGMGNIHLIRPAGLSEADQAEIVRRNILGESQASIARSLSIARQTVSIIFKRVTGINQCLRLVS
jgi:hypothetical protein